MVDDESHPPEGTPAGRTVEPPNEPALPDDGTDELDDEDADADDGDVQEEGEEPE